MKQHSFSSIIPTLIFWLILFIHLKPNAPYLFNGYQIIDIDGDSSCFISDSNSWYASQKMTSTVYSICSATYLIGGYGVLGSTSSPYSSGQYFYRTYTGLPDHNYIRFSFVIYALDSWDQNGSDGTTHYDAFDVQFDGLEIYGQSYYLNEYSSLGTICGSTLYADLPNIRVFGTVPHICSTLTVKFISDLNEVSTNESFGFRDLILLFDRNPPPSPETESLCGIPDDTSVTLDSNVCTCAKGYYSSGSTCTACDASCASCYAGTSSDCYACASGYSWDGYECISCDNSFTDVCSFTATAATSLRCKDDYVYFSTTEQCYYDCKYPLTKSSTSCSTDQCGLACSLSQYTYWDQSCSSTCDFPLQKLTMLGEVPLCIYPCGSPDYLYWDGTCQPDCPSPLTATIIAKKNLCTSPCGSNYLYPDGSCHTTCPSPLVAETIQGKYLCHTPCNAPGDYLYCNGECSQTCDPLFSEIPTNGIDYCTSSCSSGYLYWNSSCLSTCPRPLTTRIERNQMYCDYPTNTSNFLYWDGTSSSTCDPPLSQRTEGGRQFCDYTCETYQYLYSDGSCLTDCVFPFTKRVQGGQRFCDYACNSTAFLYWNGSCIDQCLPPLIATSKNSSQLCQFPDGNTSNFLYWDGTFSETCDLPFTKRIEGYPIVRKFCDNPCHFPTPYLNWNGVCQSSCSSPYQTLNITNRTMCFTSCKDTGLFMYANGTCSDECIFPYIQEIYGNEKVCHSPCSKSSLYYYWNSSCLSTCDFPYQTHKVNDVNWCVYPCSGEQFLFMDGSCLDSCEAPYESYIVSQLKHCHNPCSTSEPYLIQNGTCLSSCNSPMSLNNSTNFCSPPCPLSAPYFYVEDGECRDKCTTEAIDDSSDLYIRCLAPVPVDSTSFLDVLLGAPSGDSFSIVPLSRLIQYSRYLDITYPPRLQALAESQGRNFVTIRFGSSLSEATIASFPRYFLPSVFQRYDFIHSNFVVNFWKEMTSWLIAVLAALIFGALETLSRKRNWPLCRNIFWKLKTITKWNYLLVLIGTSFGEIALFSSFEFRTVHSGSPFTAFSFAICLVIIGLIIALILGVVFVVRKVSHLNDDPELNNKNQDEWRPYHILHKGYRNTSRKFYLFYAIRLCLPMVIASWLYFSPIVQTSMYNFITFVILAYIIKVRPITRKINQIQLVILECMVFFINICLFILALLNSSGNTLTSLGIVMGDLVVFTNTCINLTILIILVIKLVLILKAIYRFHKSHNERQDLHPWPQVFVSIMQQGGMGFEEIDFEECPLNDKEFDFKSDLLVTEKGIRAKGRSWTSVRRNTRRVAPDPMSSSSVRHNSKINQLFAVSEEAEGMDSSPNANTTAGSESHPLRQNTIVPVMVSPVWRTGRDKVFTYKSRPVSPSTAAPTIKEEAEENESDSFQYSRTNHLQNSETFQYSRTTNNPQDSDRPLKQMNMTGTFLVEMAEQGAFTEHSEDEHEGEERGVGIDGKKAIFVDPDLMKGVTMADLRKTDLRDPSKESELFSATTKYEEKSSF